MATRQPSRASARAQPRPMPLPPPVMRAVFVVNEFVGIVRCGMNRVGMAYVAVTSDGLAAEVAVTGGRHFTQIGQFSLVATRENREATPGFGIEVLVVEMERRGVALAFPLV